MLNQVKKKISMALWYDKNEKKNVQVMNEH